VRRLPLSSPEHPTAAPAAVVLVLAGLAFGIVSEGAKYEWSDVRHWLPDFIVGVVCVAAGAYALRYRRGAGVLLAATGFLWFTANLVPDLLQAYRGPLVHLLVTYPGWRPRSRPQIVAVATAYIVAVSPLWTSDAAGPLLAAAVLGVTIYRWATSHGRARRDCRTAVQAASVFAVAIAVGALVRLIEGSGDAVEPMLVLYEATIVWIAVFLAARLRPSEPGVVADLVVELGRDDSAELRDSLAAVLGDPLLRVGYWTSSGGYLDGVGSPVAIPGHDADRVATFVDRDGRPFAVLVHDAAVLDEPALVEAVATATRLGVANAALNTEVAARLAELTASRRRLIVAADDELRRLAVRLHSGVEARLAELTEAVNAVAGGCRGVTAGHLGRAADHLSHTTVDLCQLASGLHPRELDAGLAGAVTALAARSPVPVDVVVEEDAEATGETAVAAYYVCAEALTNVAKHSGASGARLEVSCDADQLFVIIADDGSGGADAANGSGLRGLTDRVEALGGTLTVTSPPAGGTRLVAELPLSS
jgi:signal transduction histidine kinase